MYKFVIAISLIVSGFILKYISRHRRIKIKREIDFDEFEDFEKIKNRNDREFEQMKNESEVLDSVYKKAFTNSITDSLYINNKDTPELDSNLSAYDILKAHRRATQKVKRVKDDLKNIKVLDRFEIKEDTISEGTTLNELKENNNNFDFLLFKKWCVQIFNCLKYGTTDQLDVVKNLMSDELYNKFVKQQKQFAKDGLEFVTEDLIVEKCYFYDYGRSSNKEELKMLIYSTMKEYIIKKSDQTVVKGNKNVMYNKNIIMTFTKYDSGTSENIIHNCPNCGSKISQTKFGKCMYCDTLLIPVRYNWTLTNFETL